MAPLDASVYSTYYGGVTAPSGRAAPLQGWYLIQLNDEAYTVSAATDTFTTTVAHGLSTSNWVWFLSLGTGTGYSTFTRYFIASVPSSTTFKISATPGGTAIDVTANGSGTFVPSTTGTTHTHWMQPQRYGEMWTVQRVTIQSDSVTLVPEVSIYKGVITPSALIDQSQNGNQDTDDLSSPLYLRAGEPVVIQYQFVDVPTPGTRTCSTWLGGNTDR